MSFFEDCTLYNTMIESDEQEEVEKVLFIELKRMGYDRGYFDKWKNGKKIENSGKLKDINKNIENWVCDGKKAKNWVDICMYFGVPDFHHTLDEFIKLSIVYKTLHHILKFGIVNEYLKDKIFEIGLNDYIKKLFIYHTIICVHHYFSFNNNISDVNEKLILCTISKYLMRCLYYDDYVINELKNNILKTYP